MLSRTAPNCPLPTTRRAPRARDENGPFTHLLLGLFDGVRAGNARAFEELRDATHARVRSMVLRVVRNEAAADEVVADVYWHVWTRVGQYSRERGHPMIWLSVLARSRALDHLRRQDAAETHPAPETLLPAVEAAIAPSPLERLVEVEQAGAVRSALARLPAMERQMVTLSYFSGLSHAEIARHARVPLGSVKTYIRRGISALRASMDARAAFEA